MKNIILTFSFFYILFYSSHLLNAQCIIELERLSDTSLKMIATGETVNSSVDGTMFGFFYSDLFNVNPSPSTVFWFGSPNTLKINGQSLVSHGITATDVRLLRNGSSVTGNLTATGEVILNWTDGVLKSNLTGVNVLHKVAAGNMNGATPICQTALSDPPSNIPTLSEWGLIVLALLFLTLGTLYLLQPHFGLLEKQEESLN